MTDRIARCLAIDEELDVLESRVRSLATEKARLRFAMPEREEEDYLDLRLKSGDEEVTKVVDMTNWPPQPAEAP